MARMQNKRIVLASRPTGMPRLENFRIEESEVPQPKEGEVLVHSLYLSVDPYMRSRMNEGKSYVPPFEINGRFSRATSLQDILGGRFTRSRDPKI